MARRPISISHPDRAALRSVAKTGCRQDVSERDDRRLGRPGSGAVVPLVRELDPSAGPLQFFGAELRRARTAAGLSQDQLGQRLGYSGAQVGKVETGERAPAQDFAEACDQAFPDDERTVRTALSAGPPLGRRLSLVVRRVGGLASGGRRRCVGGSRCWYLACCRPLITRGPSSPLIRRRPRTKLDELVAARMERQAILDKPNPPTLWVVLDEAVLHRLIGTRKIMYDQLLAPGRHVVPRQTSPCRSCLLEIGAHAGLLGGFAIASFDRCTGYRVHGVTRPGADH